MSRVAKVYCGDVSYYATVKPNMVWVEDDFRFHNHAPLEWGGCFCDLHIAEFSKRAGRELSRENSCGVFCSLVIHTLSGLYG